MAFGSHSMRLHDRCGGMITSELPTKAVTIGLPAIEITTDLLVFELQAKAITIDVPAQAIAIWYFASGHTGKLATGQVGKLPCWQISPVGKFIKHLASWQVYGKLARSATCNVAVGELASL